MDRRFILLIIGIIRIGLIILILYFTFSRIFTAPATNLVSLVPTTTSNPTRTSQQSNEDAWQTYNGSILGFTIQHPADVEIRDEQQNTVSLVKLGPTQTQGTELFDGFNVSIDVGPYSEESFKAFTEKTHKDDGDDPVTQEISTLEKVEIANKQGYQYSKVGLGEYTIVILPKEEGVFFRISKLVEDPTNQKYENTVDRMLSTLSL